MVKPEKLAGTQKSEKYLWRTELDRKMNRHDIPNIDRVIHNLSVCRRNYVTDYNPDKILYINTE